MGTTTAAGGVITVVPMASPATAHPARPRHHHGHRPRPGGRSADGQVLGVLLMVFGLGWFLRVTGAVALSWESLLSAVLIVLGVGMVVTARARAGGLMMALGILLTISLATTSSVGELGNLIGDRTVRPQTIESLEPEYKFVGGSLELDLTALEFPEGETAVEVDMGGGRIEVIVPDDDDVAVHVDAELGGGEIRLFDNPPVEGPGPEDTYTDTNYDDASSQLRLDLSGGGGQITVRRAPARAAVPDNTGSDDASRS